ncbi:MAG: polysaccharide biosynthesis/export family protein [Pseudobdellovibrionaceae bacterium]
MAMMINGKHIFNLLLTALILLSFAVPAYSAGDEDPLKIIKTTDSVAVPAPVGAPTVVASTAHPAMAKPCAEHKVYNKDPNTLPNVEGTRMPPPCGIEMSGAVTKTMQSEAFRSAYKVGAGDKLNITVYGEPSMSRTYLVNGTGDISFPLIGTVRVSGATIPEIERAIRGRLADGYFVNPSVSVEITEYRPFYIMGEVRRPGSYNYIDGMNILNAVAVGGGFTYRAKTKEIEILRETGTGEAKKIRVPPEATVLPGDIITVDERFF